MASITVNQTFSVAVVDVSLIFFFSACAESRGWRRRLLVRTCIVDTTSSEPSDLQTSSLVLALIPQCQYRTDYLLCCSRTSSKPARCVRIRPQAAPPRAHSMLQGECNTLTHSQLEELPSGTSVPGHWSVAPALASAVGLR